MATIVDDLIRDEGSREFIYLDSKGYQTIGIGVLVDPNHRGAEPMPLGVQKLWLMSILTKRKKALDAAIPWWRDENDARQRALLNMSYQLGVTGLLKFKKMLTAFEKKDYHEAAKEALDSKWAKDDTPPRAARVAFLIKNG